MCKKLGYDRLIAKHPEQRFFVGQKLDALQPYMDLTSCSLSQSYNELVIILNFNVKLDGEMEISVDGEAFPIHLRIISEYHKDHKQSLKLLNVLV
uniref:FERM domain-containing protein n=1 Tax=Syphacia muris TaxID=451379 RepID=A0A0N5ADY1_9BILA